MTLNRGDKLRYLDKRRGSMPFAVHQQHLHRRSMPVDERELQASLPQAQLSHLVRCTSYNPSEEEAHHQQGWTSDSSDSVISSGSDSDSNLYKVVLLGEHGVGKTSLARIFGGVEDCPDAEEAGEDRETGGRVAQGGSDPHACTLRVNIVHGGNFYLFQLCLYLAFLPILACILSYPHNSPVRWLRQRK